MNVGIARTGVYIPSYRMKRETIAKAWERPALKGERSVANTDEDSLTLAVAAAVSCLRGTQRETVDALLFASTTPPYAEKSSAGLAAVAADLKDTVHTADFGASARAGTSALKAALDAVAAGTNDRVVVTAADCPLGYPKSDQEQLAGDAGAAVLVAAEDLVAVYRAGYSVNNEILDSWRNADDRFPHTAEGRFAKDKGYSRAMSDVIDGLLSRAGLVPEQISKLVLASPGLRDGSQVAKRLGFAPERLVDPLMMQVGYCAAAQPLLLLASALETARPGDLILLASYGYGADAFLFEVTEAVLEQQKDAVVARNLARGRPLDSYSRFLSFRGLLETQPGEPFRTFPSTSAYWRDQASLLRLHGSKCYRCGTTTTPTNRICPTCRSKDDFELVRLSDRTARVFTYSIDRLAGRSDDPVVVQTVCEDDEKTRYYMLMTDFDAEDVKVGMPVEFTFRKIYEGGNYINYYWKCRPAASAEGE
ncbi:3-oxoacyl-[acyl-carrier-protein] synthase III C-terminal domain-containing protein [Rhodobium gokarnense]|uniref:3-hydroxy-3-methylglutaryl CoA synthase n=1 Tax=Rhodobium gokarnense TaxID=364296 RepID=A0ABT3H7F4_9HYPH|nr:3-oxoacyl-[acyl-carrier-protein] synthase III C-terminal domain-containing protein [Rhodobium gokarnense]MCW2306328.1 3-hydroxy-3-methylglutaryl CoA synthase [Rhodobium gokarnense]